jgi:hypothetical protein
MVEKQSSAFKPLTSKTPGLLPLSGWLWDLLGRILTATPKPIPELIRAVTGTPGFPALMQNVSSDDESQTILFAKLFLKRWDFSTLILESG